MQKLIKTTNSSRLILALEKFKMFDEFCEKEKFNSFNFQGTSEMASEKSSTDTSAHLNRKMEEAMTTLHNENEKLRNRIKEMENDSRKRNRENKALVDFLQVKIATLRAYVEVEEYCRKEQEV